MKYLALFIWFLSTSSAASVHVQDYRGHSIELDKPAQRIIALAPHIVENLFTAGAGDKVVGAVDYCDFPTEAKKIPRVGAISTFSLEAIVALKPDLVIAWNSGRGGQIIDKLTSLGIKTYADNPSTLEDVSRSIRDFGVLAGTSPEAKLRSQEFDRKQNLLKKNYRSKATVDVFYQVWNNPLQTLNGKHIISDVIRLCGGHNIFHDAIPIAPKISIESVIYKNPHTIITSAASETQPKSLDQWLKWPSIKAVKLNSLYFIPGDLIQRHTVRLLDGAQLLCEKLDKTRVKLQVN